MAQLAPWTSAQTRAQLAAVAWLRWRIFVNNFRSKNKKRSVAGLVGLILLRIVAWALIAGFFVGPIVGCGFAGYYIARHSPWSLSTLTWTVFSIGLFVSINISPTTLGFDLTPLLRFPLSFRSYLLVRLFFGMFSIPTVVANLALAATAIGIGIAVPSLFLWAALVLGLFALHNIFFLRMVFAWVDRWMSTKRAREIMGGVVLFTSLGFQLAIYSGNAKHRGAFFFRLGHWLAPLHPVTKYLPPSLAADAIVLYDPHALAAACIRVAGLIAFAMLFLAIFAMRLQKEYRGENLSEASARAPRQSTRAMAGRPKAALVSSDVGGASKPWRLPTTISACLDKELIYFKRSGAQLYGLITPLFFVFLLTRRNALFSNTNMLLPYAVGYVLFGLLAQLYNVLGADGAGFSLYLLAPIRLRDVILTKNLLSSTVIVTELLLTCVAVGFIRGGVPQPALLAATLSWAAFALLANLTVGNLRSLLAPMHYVPGKARKPATARGSGLMSLVVLLGTLVLGIPTIYFSNKYGMLWLATPVFVALTGGALAAYLIVLSRVDSIALKHRDNLIEALCKT